ncbi:hypothetical protein A6R68_15073, partial [Neotoma lepida]
MHLLLLLLRQASTNNSKFQSVRGIVTHLCADYGWINGTIFFNSDVVCGDVPVNIGMSVIALVEEYETSHALKTIKVRLSLLRFSYRFLPFKGDLLLVEYSLNPGTPNITIHTVSLLNSQNMDEVCVTKIDGRTGVVDDIIYFTLDSLQRPAGYTPGLYDTVNVVAVDSIQPHCSWRAVSMIPVEMCIDQT